MADPTPARPRRPRSSRGPSREPGSRLTAAQARERSKTHWKCGTCWAWYPTRAEREACTHTRLAGPHPDAEARGAD
jgi:hypothetical protein